jgi:hypothetical protein
MRYDVEANRPLPELAMRFCRRFKLRLVNFDELIHLRNFTDRLRIERLPIFLFVERHKKFHILVEPLHGCFIHPDQATLIIAQHFQSLIRKTINQNKRLLKDSSYLDDLAEDFKPRPKPKHYPRPTPRPTLSYAYRR